jgi:hypothetical protein
MAKTITPLTNTQVEKAKPKDKEYSLSDGQGLMLRIKPSGIKSWLFNYYHPITKKRKNQTLGQYPSISLANARKKRAVAKELLAQDIDPIESRNEKQSQKQLAAHHTLLVVSTAWFGLKKTKIAKKHSC